MSLKTLVDIKAQEYKNKISPSLLKTKLATLNQLIMSFSKFIDMVIENLISIDKGKIAYVYHTLALMVEIMRCFWKTCSSLCFQYISTLSWDLCQEIEVIKPVTK